MKIFNIEDGIEKIYVQKKDVIMLNQLSKHICSEKDLAINDSEISGYRSDFIQFTAPSLIAFFRKLDWIVDYKEIRALSGKELNKRIIALEKELSEMNPKRMRRRYELLMFQKQSLTDISMKKDIDKIPIVPDVDGFTLVDSNSPYQIQVALDTNRILFSRTDGQLLTGDEDIPARFLHNGIELSIMRNEDQEHLSEYFKSMFFLTDDNRYLVTQIAPQDYQLPELPKETGFQKFLRYWKKSKLK